MIPSTQLVFTQATVKITMLLYDTKDAHHCVRQEIDPNATENASQTEKSNSTSLISQYVFEPQDVLLYCRTKGYIQSVLLKNMRGADYHVTQQPPPPHHLSLSL